MSSTIGQRRRAALTTGVLVAAMVGGGTYAAVAKPGKFEVNLKKHHATVQQGQSLTVPLIIKKAKPTEIELNAIGVPKGMTATFTKTSTKASVTLTTNSTVKQGVWMIEFRGTYGKRSNSARLAVNVIPQGAAVNAQGLPLVGFELEAAQSSKSTLPGAGASYPITIRRGTVSSSVNLSLSGLPAGVTGTFSPNPAPGGSSTLTLTTPSDLTPGTYSFTVKGHGTGLVSVLEFDRELELQLVVDQPAKFEVSNKPVTVPLFPGAVQNLDVRLKNPNSQPIRVSAVTATVKSVQNAGTGCTVADYEIVQNYTGAPFTLAAHAANIALPGPATTWPQVRLKDDPMANQDGCKNATVVLEYGGTAGPVS